MTLEGKTAVVTGGGRGIGREIALRLAQEGAAVAIAARSEDELTSVAAEIESSGGRALTIVTDLRKPDDITGLEQAVTKELGATDVLVPNAGIAGAMGNLWEIPLEGWQESVDVNLTSVFLTSKKK